MQAESDSEYEEDKQTQDLPSLDSTIGFVGAGQMGEALIRGFVSSGVCSADNISASVRSTERRQAMANLGVQSFGNALEGGAANIAKSDIIVLGVRCRALNHLGTCCTVSMWCLLTMANRRYLPQPRYRSLFNL